MRTRTTPRPPTMPHQGARLKRALALQGITQSWLADQLGVSRQLVSKWITRQNWESRTVIRVAAALGLPPAYFVEEQARKKGTAAVTDRPPHNNQGARIVPRRDRAVNRRTS